MKRFWLILSLAVALASPAVAQRIRLKVSPRAGGGQTIGAGRPAQTQQQPRPSRRANSAADTRNPIEITAQTVIDEIAATGRLSRETAAAAVAALRDPAVSRLSKSLEFRAIYNRTLSYAATVTGEMALASKAAGDWRRAAPTNAAAIRNLLMVAILDGDPATAEGAIESLSGARHAKWLPWTTYMRNFPPLIGVYPKVTLDAGNGRTLVVGGFSERHSVVLFTAVGDGDPLIAALSAPFAGRPVDVMAVRLGDDTDPAAANAAKDLHVTAAPTAVVFSPHGNVLFAGDPRTWEIHMAIEAGLTMAPDAAQDGSAPVATPLTVTRAEEDKAQDLRSRGWDLVRLGFKTRSPVHKQQGRQLLEQCIREYPDSAAARQAKHDLRSFEP